MIVDAAFSEFVYKKSGIYQIVNIINNKFYIGSAKNLYTRFSQHLRELNKNRHRNSFLQRSWNKHGREAFRFEVLEFIEDWSKLRIIEQKYIDNTQCCKRHIGYNIQTKVGEHKINKGGRKTKVVPGYQWREEAKIRNRKRRSHLHGKSYNLLSPAGKLVTGKGVEEFCRKYNLLSQNVRLLLNGKIPYHNRWINLDQPLPPTVKLISPHNDIIYEVFIHELADFVKYHGIAPELFQMNSFKNNGSHIKGWCLADTPIKKYWLISPKGEKYKVISRNAYPLCRSLGLHQGVFSKLKSGEMKSYKGWICEEIKYN